MSTHRYLKGDMIHFNHKNLNLRWQSNGHWLSVWFVAWKSSKCLLAVGVFCWTFQRRSVKFGTPAPSLSCLMRQEWLFCPFFIIMYPWARQDTLLVDYYFGWFLCCWGEERGSHIKNATFSSRARKERSGDKTSLGETGGAMHHDCQEDLWNTLKCMKQRYAKWWCDRVRCMMPERCERLGNINPDFM